MGAAVAPRAPAPHRSSAACFIALVVFSVGYIIADGLRSIEVRNRDMRQALKDMASHREEFLRARDRQRPLEAQDPGEGQGQPLQGFLESAAKELDITIPEMNERPRPGARQARSSRRASTSSCAA